MYFINLYVCANTLERCNSHVKLRAQLLGIIFLLCGLQGANSGLLTNPFPAGLLTLITGIHAVSY